MKASIELNGQNHSVSLRGLNIVIYDKAVEKVADSVNFDTWSCSLTCTRANVLAEELAKWHSAHSEVTLLCFN